MKSRERGSNRDLRDDDFFKDIPENDNMERLEGTSEKRPFSGQSFLQ
jgi:hypothetical protein